MCSLSVLKLLVAEVSHGEPRNLISFLLAIS